MELLVVLAVLYGLQCFVWLSEGTTLFLGPGSWVVSHGPGWRFLHPWPSAPSLLGARLPLVEREGRLYGRAGATWWSSRGWPDRGAAFDRAAMAESQVRGLVIRVGGRPFARALSDTGARVNARFLRELARSDAEDADAQVTDMLTRSLSMSRYSQERERLVESTRWLRPASNLYGVTLYVALPVAVLAWDSEPALLRGLPLLAALHVLTLFVYASAHRRLHPDQTGALVESLVACAFYPPLLLRAYHELRTRALDGFHPAVVALASLPQERGRAFLRTEILKLAANGAESAATGLAALELHALWGLATQIGESRDTLFVGPTRDDPRAEAFCPACRAEYRRIGGRCTECQIDLVPYAS